MLWDFDCTSLYPSAMRDKSSLYPKIETGYAFTKDMNDELIKSFNSQTFTRGSAISKIKYYNPKKFVVQHLLVKEEKKILKIFVCEMVMLHKF